MMHVLQIVFQHSVISTFRYKCILLVYYGSSFLASLTLSGANPAHVTSSHADSKIPLSSFPLEIKDDGEPTTTVCETVEESEQSTFEEDLQVLNAFHTSGRNSSGVA